MIQITQWCVGGHGDRSELVRTLVLRILRWVMRRDDAEIFRMFQFELRFLEDGGYRHSSRAPWRTPYVFEDSPTCLNFQDADRPHPCAECPLMEFVPPQFRGESAPCRFILLTEAGQTIDYFYRAGTQMELEEALACWLRKRIEQIPKAKINANRRGRADQAEEPAKRAA